PIPHDPSVAHQLLLLRCVELRDLLWIELRERFSICLALSQDRVPTQARLRAFEDQELEQHPILMLRHAPLGVVVRRVPFIARPFASRHPFNSSETLVTVNHRHILCQRCLKFPSPIQICTRSASACSRVSHCHMTTGSRCIGRAIFMASVVWPTSCARSCM